MVPKLVSISRCTRRSRDPRGRRLLLPAGVARLHDVVALSRLFQRGIVGVITGRALYEGHFTLGQAIAAAA